MKIEDDGLDLGQLTYLKSFQLTSSHNNKTTKGSVIPCLTNSAGVDLDSVAFDNINLILYGGQFTDKIITSDEIINIKGCVMDNISDSQIDVTRYPSEHLHYMEFQVPPGWSDGRELVQKGEISSSRTGHCLSTLKQEGGTALLLCTGGHSKTSITKPFFHPEDSINILKVPEMFWIKLEGNDALKRSFHSQAVNSKGEVIIMGGKSMIDGRWSIIHPLTELLILEINQDFTYSGKCINLVSDIQELRCLTNFSSCVQGDIMYIFSGFKFPQYQNNNQHKFLPPITSKDHLPELGTSIFKIDLERRTILEFEGPEGCGSYNGSLVGLGNGEMVLTSDPNMYLFSERMFDSPTCDQEM